MNKSLANSRERNDSKMRPTFTDIAWATFIRDFFYLIGTIIGRQRGAWSGRAHDTRELGRNSPDRGNSSKRCGPSVDDVIVYM